MENKKVVLLATEGLSTNIVFNAMDAATGIDAVIIENAIGKATLFQRRVKKLGFIPVTGQVLFLLFVVPVLKLLSKKRTLALQSQFGLDTSPVPSAKIIKVPSVNSDAAVSLLKELSPALVIVNGTRIISNKTLSEVPATFINMHAGITPAYRGVHGAYWALVNDDKAHCGVTVHLVDKGIDTGGVLYQQTIEIGKEDNFTTYPLLQLGTGLPLLMKAAENCLIGEQQIIPVNSESHLWHHPSLWQYLYYFFAMKVR